MSLSSMMKVGSSLLVVWFVKSSFLKRTLKSMLLDVISQEKDIYVLNSA